MSQKNIYTLGWRARKRGGGLIVPICHVVIRVEGCKEGAEGSLSQKVIQMFGWRAGTRGGGLIVQKSQVDIGVEGCKKGRRAHCPNMSSCY